MVLYDTKVDQAIIFSLKNIYAETTSYCFYLPVHQKLIQVPTEAHTVCLYKALPVQSEPVTLVS